LNLSVLGDALDFWKGCLLNRLTSSGLLLDLEVHPLLTDHQLWRDADFALYAELLKVHCKAIHPNGEVKNAAGDLYLDPNIGVQTSRVAVAEKANYVTPIEVARLANDSLTRVVAVYQYVSRRRVRDRVGAVVAALQAVNPGLSVCSIESGTVAMLFASRNAKRVGGIYQHFLGLFRNRSSYRTNLWPALYAR
jgi:hypothetical protein